MNVKLFKLSLFVFIIAVIPFTVFGINFYVAPSGSDNADGSEATPFATIAKARDAAKSLGTLSEDVHIFLRGGTYFLSSPLIFDNSNSGSGGYNIIYEAYPGEEPVISGGYKIAGGWSLFDSQKNIFRTYLGTTKDTRQLYVNGVRATRARSIDGTGWNVISAGDRNSDASYNCPTAVATWANNTAIELAIRSTWSFHRSKLKSVNGTVAQGTGWLIWNGESDILWVENAYELLDSNGEWYLDRSTGYLYYKPRNGENLSKAEVIIGNLETLVQGAGVNHIQFKGITFSHATWLYANTNGINNGQADVYNGSYSTFIYGNINFSNSSYLRFEENTFIHLGSTALRLASGNNITVFNNTFRDISASAISVGDPRTISLTRYITIDNNDIRDCAVEYKGSIGIFGGSTKNTLITHNEIRNMPKDGIAFGLDAGRDGNRNLEISYNKVDSVLLLLRDGGGIYIKEKSDGSIVHDNYVSYAKRAHGLYTDDRNSNSHWYNNVVSKEYDAWIRDTPPQTGVKIDSNWFNKNNDQWTGGENCEFRNNTFVNGSWPAPAQSIIEKAGRRKSGDVIVTGIEVSPATAIIEDKSLLQLDAAIFPSNASNKTLSWTSSNPSVATVSDSGLVQALSAGTATITVAASDINQIDSCVITVSRIDITHISLNITSTISGTGTQQLSAIISPSNANYPDLKWTSSNLGTAKVNNSGLVTGVTSGTSVITVSTIDGSITADCSVTVENVVLTGVNLIPELSLGLGATAKLVTTVSPSNANNKTITWTSENPQVATVDFNTGLITGIAEGATRIMAKTLSGNFTDTCNVSVISNNCSCNATNGGISSDDSAGGGVANVFDKIIAGVWNIPATSGNIEYEFAGGASKTINKYTLISDGAFLYQSPGSWNFQGWDGYSWITLDIRINISFKTNLEQSFVFNNSTAFPKYRLHIISGINPLDENLSLNELQMFYCKKNVVFVSGVAITSPKTVNIQVGGKFQPAFTIKPDNASMNSVVWTSKDSTIAKVDKHSGEVTGVAPGQTNISVITDDGSQVGKFIVIVNFTANINNSSSENDVLVYPNPVSNNLTISGNETLKSCKIDLFNGMGELVYKQVVLGNPFIIDMSKYPGGLYILQLTTSEGKTRAVKIMKTK
jgi:uncharacterized protein YjdB